MAEAARDRAARSCRGHGGAGQKDAEADMLGHRLGATVMLAGGAALVYFGFLRDWRDLPGIVAGLAARADGG